MVLIKCVPQPGQVFYGFILVFVVTDGHFSWCNSIAHFFNSSFVPDFCFCFVLFFLQFWRISAKGIPFSTLAIFLSFTLFQSSNLKFPFYLISVTWTPNFFFTKIQVPFFRGLKTLLDKLLVISYRVRLDSNLPPWNAEFEPASHLPLCQNLNSF